MAKGYWISKFRDYYEIRDGNNKFISSADTLTEAKEDLAILEKEELEKNSGE